VNHIFKPDRSVEFYRTFFRTYGSSFGEDGLIRVAKLSVHGKAPNNFFVALNQVYRDENESKLSLNELTRAISGQLRGLEITNQCIGELRSAFLRQVKNVDKVDDDFDDETEVELDIGRPILRLEKLEPEKQLATQIKIIDQILESRDSLVLEKLFENNLLNLLNQIAELKNDKIKDIRISIFDILSKISSEKKYKKYLNKTPILVNAINGLNDSSVEIR